MDSRMRSVGGRRTKRVISDAPIKSVKVNSQKRPVDAKQDDIDKTRKTKKRVRFDAPTRASTMRSRKRHVDANQDNIDKNRKTKKAKPDEPNKPNEPNKPGPMSSKIMTKLTSDSMAAIYYDIHNLCLLQAAIKYVPQPSDLKRYRFECREAAAAVFMGVLLKSNASPADKDKEYEQQQERIGFFLEKLDWMMLAICAYSSAFRQAITGADQKLWELLVDMIWVNRQSIEIFARTRGLVWRDMLLGFVDRLPELRQAAEPLEDLSKHHPHQIVRTLKGTLARPTFEGCEQMHVDDCIFDPSQWDGETDPTIRTKADGACDICSSTDICKCKLVTETGKFVELIEYPVKGVGVRSLSKFSKDKILDEFIGEIRPCDYRDDPIYGLLHESKNTDDASKWAVISPKHYGNWTRFINHSCNPSCRFVKRTIGERTVMTIETLRDISIFEEITVDYGEGYWRTRVCHCCEPDCYYLEFEEDEEEVEEEAEEDKEE